MIVWGYIRLYVTSVWFSWNTWFYILAVGCCLSEPSCHAIKPRSHWKTLCRCSSHIPKLIWQQKSSSSHVYHTSWTSGLAELSDDSDPATAYYNYMRFQSRTTQLSSINLQKNVRDNNKLSHATTFWGHLSYNQYLEKSSFLSQAFKRFSSLFLTLFPFPFPLFYLANFYFFF